MSTVVVGERIDAGPGSPAVPLTDAALVAASQKIDAATGSVVDATPWRTIPELMKQFFGASTQVSEGLHVAHAGGTHWEFVVHVRKALTEQWPSEVAVQPPSFGARKPGAVGSGRQSPRWQKPPGHSLLSLQGTASLAPPTHAASQSFGCSRTAPPAGQKHWKLQLAPGHSEPLVHVAPLLAPPAQVFPLNAGWSHWTVGARVTVAVVVGLNRMSSVPMTFAGGGQSMLGFPKSVVGPPYGGLRRQAPS